MVIRRCPVPILLLESRQNAKLSFIDDIRGLGKDRIACVQHNGEIARGAIPPCFMASPPAIGIGRGQFILRVGRHARSRIGHIGHSAFIPLIGSNIAIGVRAHRRCAFSWLARDLIFLPLSIERGVGVDVKGGTRNIICSIAAGPCIPPDKCIAGLCQIAGIAQNGDGAAGGIRSSIRGYRTGSRAVAVVGHGVGDGSSQLQFAAFCRGNIAIIIACKLCGIGSRQLCNVCTVGLRKDPGCCHSDADRVVPTGQCAVYGNRNAAGQVDVVCPAAYCISGDHRATGNIEDGSGIEYINTASIEGSRVAGYGTAVHIEGSIVAHIHTAAT